VWRPFSSWKGPPYFSSSRIKAGKWRRGDDAFLDGL
jgi:hypothetical protein